MIDYDTLSTRLSDEDDLYAHESQILIKNIGGVDYLFMIYMSNKETLLEWQLTGHALLKIFNLSTLSYIRTFDLFYAGLEAGVTMPADKVINVPRMYFYGENTLRCFCPNTSTLFTRDVTISDSNPANWIAGNISIVQMTMKDAEGDDVLADVTSANINIHLDYIFGDDAANYHDLMPLFRNLDPAKSGNNWYSTLECSSEASHELARPTLCVYSSDAGGSWTFGSPIGYTTETRNQCVESAMIFIGTDLHLIGRSAPYVHYKSEDNGATWVAQATLPFYSPNTKPCGINYLNGAELENVFALNTWSEIVGDNGRTTLLIFSTDDFTHYNTIGKMVTAAYSHYPSLCNYNGHIYLAATGSTNILTSSRNQIRFIRIV